MVTAEISLFSKEAGGKTKPIGPHAYSCPLFFDGIEALSGHGYDARLHTDREIWPGESSAVRLEFLSRDEVLRHIRPGTTFSIWEGKEIGRGKIIAFI